MGDTRQSEVQPQRCIPLTLRFSVLHCSLNMLSIFGYWSIKGLGQAPRLLMEYVGEDYKEQRYDPTTDSEKWQTFKASNPQGFAFPNLPYYINGKDKLTHSNAILRYLARKHGLAGNSEEENKQLDMLDAQTLDLRVSWGMMCHSPDEKTFNKTKEIFKPMIVSNLTSLDKYLGSKKFVLGDRISYVDFLIYDLCTIFLQLDSALLEGLDNLKGLLKRFEALPTIASYMKSERFIKWPLNGPSAFWGGK